MLATKKMYSLSIFLGLNVFIKLIHNIYKYLPYMVGYSGDEGVYPYEL